MNIVKKSFAIVSSSVLALASIASLGVLPARAALDATGTNVVSNGTVYFLDGVSKRPYTSAGAFLSYGFNSWGTVVPASAEDLALPTGAFVPAADGSLINDMGTVYLITNGQREGFTSAANFLGLGYSFSNVLPGDTSFMTSGPVISTTDMAHPAGTLVNQAGTVYLLTTTGKQGIPSLSVFNSWGYSFSKVVPANSYDDALAMSAGVMPTFVAGCLSPLNCGSTGVVTPPGTPVATGNVTATLSTDTPAGSPTVVASQASADIGNFTFNGTGTVTSLTFTRVGVSSNNSLDNVYLYEGGTRLTSGASVNTNNTVTFSNANGLFTVNGPTEIHVTADIDSLASAGQTVGFQLTSGMTGTTAIAGTPVTSNLSQIAVAQNLATATLGSGGSITPTNTTVNAGTSNYVLWSDSVTVSNHAVNLASASFEEIGSAPSSALTTWALFLDGTQVATSTGVNANNYVVFTPANPVAMNTGSHTLSVEANIVGGSDRTVQLSLQNGSDLLLTDTNYNINITPENQGATTGAYFSPVSAGTVTINQGTLSISLDPSFNNTTNIPAGATSQPIASFQLQSYGENVQINNLSVTPTIGLTVSGTTPSGNPTGPTCTAGTNCGLQNVSLFYNGAEVGTNENWSGTGALSFNLGSSLVVTAGTPGILQVKADLQNSAGASYTGGQVDATLNAGSSNYQGLTSLSTGNTPATTGQTLSIGGSTGTLSLNTALSNTTVLSNSTAQRIGSYIVQAGSSEGLRVTSATVGLAFQPVLSAGTVTTSTSTATVTGSGTAFTSAYVGGTLVVGAHTYTVASVTDATHLTITTNGAVSAGSLTYTLTGVLSTSYLNNLKVAVSNCSGSAYTSSPVQPSSTNNFSLSCNLAANSSAIIDVYADIGNANGTVTTNLSVLGQGQTSNTTFYGNSTDTSGAGALGGQVTSVTSGSVGSVTLGASAATSALVASAVSPTVGPQTAAAFNFVSNVGVTSIQEMWIAVDNASGTPYTTSTAPTAPVTQVTVSGPGVSGGTSTASAPVIYTSSGNFAHVTGLNIQVPQGNAGQDVAITPTYNFVGTNGLTTGTKVELGLTEYKYQAGQTVTDTGNGAGLSSPTITITSNPMEIVASYPTVVNTNGIVGVSSGAPFGNGQQVLQFSITASSSGPVRVKQIQVTPYFSGTLTNASHEAVQIYNTANPSVILDSTQVGAAPASGGVALVSGTPVAIILNNDEVIAAGTSKTYTITVDTSGLGAASGNSFSLSLTTTGGTGALTTGAASGQWAWNDSTVTGIGTGSEQYLDAYLVQNLPVTGPTFTK